MSFSKPWGLGCAEYQYEQQWFMGLAYDRAVILLIRRLNTAILSTQPLSHLSSLSIAGLNFLLFAYILLDDR